MKFKYITTFLLTILWVSIFPLSLCAQHTSRQEKGTLSVQSGIVPRILSNKSNVYIHFDFSKVEDPDGNDITVILKKLKWKESDYQTAIKEGVNYFLDKWENVADGCKITDKGNEAYDIEVIVTQFNLTKSIFGTNYMDGMINILDSSGELVCRMAFNNHYGTKTMDVERGKSVKWMLNDLAEELYFVLLNPVGNTVVDDTIKF